tara:strand:- start:124 stop:492 length:369 start_codon:yes stop_codon:yes gene_type:complete
MKISKKRLVEIIEEECAGMEHDQMYHDVDEEGRMAKRQLYDMEKYARELSQMLSDTTQLESWVQAKLTKAADYLKTVKHYVEYGMEEGAYDQVKPKMDQMEPMDVDMSNDAVIKMLEELGES